MAWIKFDIGTSEKPEVWQIAGQLSLDPDSVVGKLLRVWAWFDEHTTDGNAPSVTKALLDSKLRVIGFCDAMVGCGWMLESNGQISLPNFDRHNGHTAKNRALSAKRAAMHKDSKTKVTQNFDFGNAKVTLGALPREEKIREEKIREELNTNTPPNPQGGKRGRKPSFIPSPAFDELGFPPTHQDQAMRDAWDAWLNYRESIGKPVSVHSATPTVNALGRQQPREAIASIYRTIAKQWQGIVVCPSNEISLYCQRDPNEEEILF